MTDEEERKMWENIHRLNQERFDAAKVCERCKVHPPKFIMTVSSYVAVCEECRKQIYAEMDEHLESMKRMREEQWVDNLEGC